MNSNNFVNSLKNIEPTIKELENKGYDDLGFIKKYLKRYSLKEKLDIQYSKHDDPILDLIDRFDVSNFEVASIVFNQRNEVAEDENYIYFGNYDVFPLVIVKATNEIVELDWNDNNYIVSRCAVNSNCFLNSLIEVEKYYQSLSFDDDENQELIYETTVNISKIAGGNKYKEFYLSVLGYEGNGTD